MERMRTQTIAKSQNNNDDLELYKPCSFGSYTAVKRTVEILRHAGMLANHVKHIRHMYI